MKVAVIVTGGTIGSRKGKDGWISPNPEKPCEILEWYRQAAPVQAVGISFDCIAPYQILSENLNGRYLTQLIETVRSCMEKKAYDGILICHGTDTLQYTAAILGYVFADSDIPILLISSNAPLEEERANGRANFRYGIETLSKGLRGVFAVYRNRDGNTYVHDGIKLLAHETCEDDLHSMGREYIGYYDRSGNWCPGSKEREPIRPVPCRRLTDDTRGILWLRVYPGMSYPLLTGAIKAVLFESYHSGTIPVEGSFRQFAESARALSIPIYLTGAADTEGGYETMREYEEAGVQVLKNQTPIAAYCRLWLMLS